MFIKKFQAATLEEALKRVRVELGAEALILSTNIQRGTLLKKGYVEVTAATQPKVSTPATEKAQMDELIRVFPHRKSMERKQKAEVISQPKKEIPKGTKYVDIGEIANETKTVASSPVRGSSAKIEEWFMRRGFANDSARELSHTLIHNCPKNELLNQRSLDKAKSRLLSSKIKTFPLEALTQRRFWMPIGPAGVGKTTFLVKLAACLKNRDIPVAISSRDRRKLIGSSELAAYARIAKIPFLFDLREMKGQKVCLIDCSSISYEADEINDEIERVLRTHDRHGTFLVLDATMRLSEMLRIFDAAQRFSPEAVVFTKMDLASQFGSVFDFLKKSKLPFLASSVSQSFLIRLLNLNSSELADFIMSDGEAFRSNEKSA